MAHICHQAWLKWPRPVDLYQCGYIDRNAITDLITTITLVSIDKLAASARNVPLNVYRPGLVWVGQRQLSFGLLPQVGQNHRRVQGGARKGRGDSIWQWYS